jgi:hypothetical protein
MSLLLTPVLAQVLTAGLGDRVEARVVAEPDETYLEAENLGYATAALEMSHLTLRGIYAPSVLVTPLDRDERELSVRHTLSGLVATGVDVYESRTVLASIGAVGMYVQEDVRRQMLGAPLPSSPSEAPEPDAPTSAPEAGAERAVPAVGITTRSVNGRAGITALERLSSRNRFEQYAGYAVSTGLDEESRELYPLTHGPEARVVFQHLWSRRDTLVTTATGEMTFIPRNQERGLSERASSLGANQGIIHRFSRETSGDASAGAEYTRFDSSEEGRVAEVSPTGHVGITHSSLLARGRFEVRGQISYEPTLDRSTLVFDKRFDASASVNWRRDPWTLYATGSATVSVDITSEGALRTISSTAGADYEIGSGFAAHAGARMFWETYRGVEVVPATTVGFIALSWFAEFP